MKRIRRRIDLDWPSVRVRERVHFYDLDPMQVVWHGRYARFMEIAREVFFSGRGVSYARLQAWGWAAPVARMQLEYLAPARGGEELVIDAAAIPQDKCMLDLLFEIRRSDDRLCCVAESIQVFWDEHGEVLRVVPDRLRGLLVLEEGV